MYVTAMVVASEDSKVPQNIEQSVILMAIENVKGITVHNL